MTTRALNRSGQPAAPLIELPVLSRPQVVNQDGFELDEEEIAALEDTLRAENGTSDVLDDRGTVGTEAKLDGEVIIQPGEGEEDREPVLSLADRWVHATLHIEPASELT